MKYSNDIGNTKARAASMPASRSKHLRGLSPGQLCLWTVRSADFDDSATSQFLLILSKDEQNEAFRFRHAADRDRFIVGRSLARLALSHHLPVHATAWRFDRDHNGRPFVAAPRVLPPVHFSLSHTEGLIACLTSLSVHAAVDVEKVEDNRDLALVAEQIFSPTELQTLHRLSGADWTARFFDYWTLKEAYAKARGLGLGLTLGDIGFEFESEHTIRADFASNLNDDPSAWMFWLDHPSPQHTISVAAKRLLHSECKIIQRSVKFSIVGGAVVGVVGIEGGVVSGVINLESSGVRAPVWRPRHDEHHHEA